MTLSPSYRCFLRYRDCFNSSVRCRTPCYLCLAGWALLTMTPWLIRGYVFTACGATRG